MNIAPALRLGHATPACALARAPHARLLASGDHVGRVLLWDLDGDELPRVIRPPSVPRVRSWTSREKPLLRCTEEIEDLAFLAASRLLAVAHPTRVTVYDVATGALVATFRGCGRPLAPDGDQVWARRAGSFVRLDPRAGTVSATWRLPGIPRHHGPVALDLSHPRAGVLDDDRLLLWDRDSTRPRVVRLDAPHNGQGGLAFAPDGRRVAVACSQHVVIVDLGTGALEGAAAHDAGALAWDGARLVSGGTSGLYVGGERVSDEWVSALVASPERALAGAHGDIRTPTRAIPGADAGIHALSFHGPLLRSAHADGVVRTWHVRSRRLVEAHRGPGGVPLAIDGPWVASTRLSSRHEPVEPTFLWVWHSSTGGVRFRAELGSRTRSGAALAGGKVGVAGFPSLLVWDVSSGDRILERPGRAYPLAFSPDGMRMVCADRRDLLMVDLRTGETTRLGDADTVAHLAFSPDGRRLAVGSFALSIEVWDLAGGGSKRHAVLGDLHHVAVTDAAASPPSPLMGNAPASTTATAGAPYRRTPATAAPSPSAPAASSPPAPPTGPYTSTVATGACSSPSRCSRPATSG